MLRIVNFVPPVFVASLILIPHLIYVFINCRILLEDEVRNARVHVSVSRNSNPLSDQAPGPMFGYICLVIHHILLVLLLWSFAMSVFVDPGRVPEWVTQMRFVDSKHSHNYDIV